MAKVRVYELARELNLESKELVEKLIAGGMNIKNYMSTLDEDSVRKAKDIVSGAVSEVIEEQRIKPTIIRRRKKKVKLAPEVPAEKTEEEPVEVEAEAPEIEAVEEAVEEKEVTEEALELTEDSKETTEAEVEAIPEKIEPEEEPSERELEDEPPSAEEAPKVKEKAKAKRKKTKKKKSEQPAKIIKSAEEGPLKDLLSKKEKDEPKPKAKTAPKKEAKKPAEVAKEVSEKEKKGKPRKRKKERRASEKVSDAPKAGIRRKKREVFERADLYSARAIGRKGKKAQKKSKEVSRRQKQTEITTPKAIKRRIKVQKVISTTELAKGMGLKVVELVKALMKLGVTANINQNLDFETASVLADEFGFELELDTFQEEQLLGGIEDEPESLEPRPPVVTIMGHVDHGKTSLLDYIRKSNIIGGESGGITQHIGAYYVETEGGDIVFLDTPGHEAFTAMRARGAKVTDIIVLVVAADDGVMPQTREAVNHARAANIPIVVAINKIDKPEANPEKVKRELAELDLAPEEWGGETIFGNVSAKSGEGIDELLNLILLQSEILELKANPNREARGTVVEAHLDKNRGPVATVLIKNGCLGQGEHFVCGHHHGRVRAMLNNRGKKMKSARPSFPAEIYGISGVPMAGDEFIVVKDEKTAKQVIEHRVSTTKEQEISKKGVVSLDDLFEKIKEGEVKELNIVVKADVQGSLEALSDSLLKLSTDQVKLKTIHMATGAITESDVMLASASGAIIIAFNVRANPRVSELAEREKIDIRFYDVIYNVLKDIRSAMVGLLDPVFKENIIGRADIKEVFKVPKIGAVAGCYVTDGRIERNANVRVLRDEVVVFDGKIGSLRRFKDDVKDVQTGYECGIGVEKFQDIKPGDVFEVYQLEEIEAEL